MGFKDPLIGFNDVFSAGSTWPSVVAPGDEVWAWVVGIDTPTTAFTPPAGWTQIGSTTNWGTSNAALFKHTYAAGDTFPAASAWKGGTFNLYVHSFVIASSSGYSIHTDTTATGTLNASLQGTLPKFSPADAANDLRILLLACQGSFTANDTGNIAAVTATDANPTGQKMKLMGAIASSATAMEAVYRGFWADPSPGLDAVDGVCVFTNSVAGRNYLCRSICLTDGSGAGGYDSKEQAFNQADPNIHAEALVGTLAGALDAAKGRYVGGARIL